MVINEFVIKSIVATTLLNSWQMGLFETEAQNLAIQQLFMGQQTEPSEHFHNESNPTPCF